MPDRRRLSRRWTSSLHQSEPAWCTRLDALVDGRLIVAQLLVPRLLLLGIVTVDMRGELKALAPHALPECPVILGGTGGGTACALLELACHQVHLHFSKGCLQSGQRPSAIREPKDFESTPRNEDRVGLRCNLRIGRQLQEAVIHPQNLIVLESAATSNQVDQIAHTEKRRIDLLLNCH